MEIQLRGAEGLSEGCGLKRREEGMVFGKAWGYGHGDSSDVVGGEERRS